MRKLLIFIVLLSLTGCSPYDYRSTYGLSSELLSRAEHIKGGEGLIIDKITPNKFTEIKKMVLKKGFKKWYPLSDITTGKFSLNSSKNKDVIFSKGNHLDGITFVIAYDKLKNKIYLIAADMIGG
jgi:hypothetical protein